ncbi:hypothetical protein Zm00014a_032192 [Zea mays]|jgi:hypothetical protein|uniref:Uncharacterized protein n=1 Tax=Zea mays TaxID=4577 RepID=A0A3L6EW59_MAIZE|nr:hypothetical protein Zm00014a_032192 [Zea mays]
MLPICLDLGWGITNNLKLVFLRIFLLGYVVLQE